MGTEETTCQHQGVSNRGEENIFFVGSFEVKIITKFKHMNKLINEDVTK